jgi:cytosine/adenosine deaminase-related metal-dependent hydrolase
MGAVIHSAPLILPIAEPPIRDAALAVRDGRVLAVGPRRDVLAAHPGEEEIRWDGLVVAGLVNAHTHLQYTHLASVGRRRYGSFEEWSAAFDAAYFGTGDVDWASGARGGGRDVDWASSARDGAQAAIAAGTTAVADVVTDLEALTAWHEAGLGGVAYLEVLGDTAESWLREGRDRLITALRETGVAVGISPHAPYSLDTPVLEDLARLCRSYGLRQHIHLAESAHEREYTVSGTGPLAAMVRGLGFDFAMLREGGSGLGPADLLDSMGAFGPHCHVAHGVFLTADDRAILRKRETAVALCPRSNLTLGLGGPDVAALLEEDSPVAVGTDSLASSPSLDLLEDVRLLRDLARAQGYRGSTAAEPDLRSGSDLERRLVEAATSGGAHALGLATGPGRVGSLTPGARADFAVFDVDPAIPDPYRTLVETGPGRCAATVIAGNLVWNGRVR